MMNIFRFIDNLLVPKPSAPRVVLLQQRTANSPALRPTGSRILVQRNPQPYWQENGWRKQDGVYSGDFQTRFGRWPGSITVSPGRRIDVLILNPPATLENHPHWPCFRKRDGGWYFIHPVEPVKDVSAAIISVEKTINESYEI